LLNFNLYFICKLKFLRFTSFELFFIHVLYNYRPGVLTVCTPTFAVYDVPLAANGSDLLLDAATTSVQLTIAAGVIVSVALPVLQ
jgi:hypothetical protein